MWIDRNAPKIRSQCIKTGLSHRERRLIGLEINSTSSKWSLKQSNLGGIQPFYSRLFSKKSGHPTAEDGSCFIITMRAFSQYLKQLQNMYLTPGIAVAECIV